MVVASGSLSCLRWNDWSLDAALYAALTSAAVSQDRRRYEHPSHLTQYSQTGLPFATFALRFASAATRRASSVPSSSSSASGTSIASAQNTIFSILSRGSLSLSYPSSSSDASRSESSSSESRSRSGFFAAAARLARGSRGA